MQHELKVKNAINNWKRTGVEIVIKHYPDPHNLIVICESRDSTSLVVN